MKLRLYTALFVLAVLLVFAGQNFSQLTVRFLVWSFQIPQALLIISCSALGLLVGWLLGIMRRSSGD
jgi:uncharacterized integral membrane protein